MNSDQKNTIELVEWAQLRIRQKKRLYWHTVLFVIGSVALWIINVGIGYYEHFFIFNYPWFLTVVGLWLLLLLFHAFNVFVTHRLLSKRWERNQLEKMVQKQQLRIEVLKNQFEKETRQKAEAAWKAQERSNQNLTLIAAVGEHNELGKDNQLIWHLSDDLKRFKKLTKGHAVIMGRKTFDSLPKALPNRRNIVVSRQNKFKADDIETATSLEAALEMVADDTQPFIIGGGEIYKQAIERANSIELTRVHHTFDADTFFPAIDPNVWKLTWEEKHISDENHLYDFSFQRFER